MEILVYVLGVIVTAAFWAWVFYRNGRPTCSEFFLVVLSVCALSWVGLIILVIAVVAVHYLDKRA